MLDIRTVQYAILETDGSLSVFPYPKDRPATAKEAGIPAKPQLLPVSIIEDGYVFEKNLKLAGKNRQWLEKTLAKYQAQEKNTLLLTVDEQDHVLWLGKEP